MSFSDEVLRKIALLRSMDPALALFGASTHRYQFNAPLQAAEIAAFEASHSLRLPEDYRDFILNVGNGGAGPCYGIYPLQLEDNIHPGMVKRSAIDLSTAFRWAESWNAEWIAQIDWDAGERPDDCRLEEYLDIRHIAGTVCICHEGCGDFWLLVLKGNERGHLWMDGRGNFSGIFPESDARGARLTFSQWYRNWLDDCLQRAGAG